MLTVKTIFGDDVDDATDRIIAIEDCGTTMHNLDFGNAGEGDGGKIGTLQIHIVEPSAIE